MELVSRYVIRRRFARDFADVVVTKTQGFIEKRDGKKYFIAQNILNPVSLENTILDNASACVVCETLDEAHSIAYNAIDDAIERVSKAKVVFE